MTIADLTVRKTYAGDDVTTSFDTSPLTFAAAADVDVYVVDDTTGGVEVLVQDTDYTTTVGLIAGTIDTGIINLAGGSLPYGALPTGSTLIITRTTARSQETDLVNGDGSDAETLEYALDYLTLLAQELYNHSDRTLRLADSDTYSGEMVLPSAVDRANKGLFFNSDGDPIASDDSIDGALVDAFWSPIIDRGIDDLTAETETASDDLLLLSDTSAGTGKKLALSNLSKHAGTLATCRGLTLRTNAGAPTTTVNIAADEVVLEDSSGYPFKVSSVSLTPAITTSGANGLDTGAEAGDTWYYVYVIAKADGTVAGLFSTSATSPTMPSGYTFKALVGAVRNNGSSNFINFRQIGNEYFYAAGQNVVTTTTASTTEQTVTPTAQVPAIARVVRLTVRGTIVAGGGGNVATTLGVRHVTTEAYWVRAIDIATSGRGNFGGDPEIHIAASGTILWLFANATNVSTAQLDIDVVGFKLPIGGE